MSVIRELRAAINTVQKKRFMGLTSPQFVYVNTRGLTIFEAWHNEIEAVRKEGNQRTRRVERKLEEQKKEAEKTKKEAEKTKKEAEKTKKEAEKTKKEMKKLQKTQKRMQDWASTIQPLEGIAIEIRLRFFANYEKGMGEKSADITKMIRKGNDAAHTGNVITDTAMISLGHIRNTGLFHELYGITHDTAQCYFSIYSSL